MKSTTERVRSHRAALQRKGMRPIQLWIPDLRDAAVRKELRRQMKILNQSATTQETLQAFNSIADLRGWT